MAILCALPLALAFACGSSSKTSEPTGPTPPAPGAEADAPAAPVAETPTAGDGAPVTQAECEALLDHILDIQITALRNQSPEAVPDEAAIQAMRDEVKREHTAECMETVTRAAFECGMAATNADEIAACDEAAAEGG